MQQEKLSDVDCALSSSQDEKCSQNTSRGGLSVKTGTEHAAGTTGEGLPGPGHPAASHAFSANPRSPGVHISSQHPPALQLFESLAGPSPESHHWRAPLGSLAAEPCTLPSSPPSRVFLAEKLQQHECVLTARVPQLLLSLRLAWRSADSPSPCPCVSLHPALTTTQASAARPQRSSVCTPPLLAVLASGS
ncbi:unnamed protein product [Rangifer tarandus platyrhynchus]|uniref:Uncharacterized protein n=1 Tax=Rangifer tarandus platyrhynchus TaxID=3082113 RepID=A0AC60A8W8_RANTA